MQAIQRLVVTEAGSSGAIKLLLVESMQSPAPNPDDAGRCIGGAVAMLSRPLPDGPPAGGAARGGLTPWQVARVRSVIEAGLDRRLTTADLASAVRLSLSHFSRAFKISFGTSPHVYVVRRRIDLAKHLMTATRDPLCDIALACGLADQAHLSHLFHRHVGEPPNAWRKRRVEPTQPKVDFSRHRSDPSIVGERRQTLTSRQVWRTANPINPRLEGDRS